MISKCIFLLLAQIQGTDMGHLGSYLHTFPQSCYICLHIQSLDFTDERTGEQTSGISLVPGSTCWGIHGFRQIQQNK